jgi:FtsZ-binding cell division protein ZapB
LGLFLWAAPETIQRVKKMSDNVDLNSPEVKAAIQAAVDAAVQPLIAKRDELLGEVKTLRKGKQIAPEDLEKLEAENEALKGELNKATGELKTAKKTAEDATKKLEFEVGITNKSTVDTKLTEAFLKAGVNDQDYIDLLKAKHASLAKVVIDGDNRKVMFGDKDLDTYLTEWKSTDAAKKFIAADNNSGGGANGGGNNNSNSKTMTRSAFDAADHGTRAAFAKAGGTVIDG